MSQASQPVCYRTVRSLFEAALPAVHGSLRLRLLSPLPWQGGR
jgi:hypothetical protein